MFQIHKKNGGGKKLDFKWDDSFLLPLTSYEPERPDMQSAIISFEAYEHTYKRGYEYPIDEYIVLNTVLKI